MSLVSEKADIPVVAAPSTDDGGRRLWKLIGWVALGHVVVILVLSPGLYCAGGNSPEALLERGERAMNEGKHAEAMELFRRVMDQQPKPPPIYTKAADLHRLADRQAREAAGKGQGSQPATQRTGSTVEVPMPPSVSPTATRPATPAKAAEPDKPFIPPELLPGGAP
jgi:hypothetical protein